MPSSCRRGTSWSSTKCTSARSTTRPAPRPGHLRRNHPEVSLPARSRRSTPSRSCRSPSSRWTIRGATTRRSRFRSRRLSAARRDCYRFVKAAHAHGIAVLIDVVYNHFGPGDLDLWRFDGWTDADHGGGIYFYDNRRAQTPWGDYASGLRTARGAPVHPRQRAVLAEQVPARRPAVRLGRQHAEPRREQQRPRQRPA